jgi:hypothetical protein
MDSLVAKRFNNPALSSFWSVASQLAEVLRFRLLFAFDLLSEGSFGSTLKQGGGLLMSSSIALSVSSSSSSSLILALSAAGFANLWTSRYLRMTKSHEKATRQQVLFGDRHWEFHLGDRLPRVQSAV